MIECEVVKVVMTRKPRMSCYYIIYKFLVTVRR
jgi:hypothetical protein